jgi:thioredoxin-like negative regulator of GroEL
MPLQEITEQQLLQHALRGNEKEAVLIYTPLCGTCRLAERMLEIAEAADPSVPMYKLNINFAPVLRDTWKIASIPCLVLIKDGVPVRFEYAMRSVDYLYGVLKG